MNRVNPPPQLRIPDEFQRNPQMRAYFEASNRILFQLWSRTGGADDAIDTLFTLNTYETTSLAGRLAGETQRIEENHVLATRIDGRAVVAQLTADQAIQSALTQTQARISALENELESLRAQVNGLRGASNKLDELEILAYACTAQIPGP
jgi:hypothetical protein